MNKTPTQLAEEAWRKIINPPEELSNEQSIAIIQAAIEKAYRQGLNEGFGKGKQAGIRDQISKAAHASEDLLHEATKMLANYSSYSEKERARFYAKVNRRAAQASDNLINAEGIKRFQAAQASGCDHQWTDYGTLVMPEQGPPLEIEQCVRCGVQQRKQRAAHASEPWTPDKVLEILDEAEEKGIVWNKAVADAHNATMVIAPKKDEHR